MTSSGFVLTKLTQANLALRDWIVLSCVPAHHYPSPHSIHSNSEQRKWLSDITKAPVSQALPQPCILCEHNKATPQPTVGYGADLAGLASSIWPRMLPAWTLRCCTGITTGRSAVVHSMTFVHCKQKIFILKYHWYIGIIPQAYWMHHCGAALASEPLKSARVLQQSERGDTWGTLPE